MAKNVPVDQPRCEMSFFDNYRYFQKPCPFTCVTSGGGGGGGGEGRRNLAGKSRTPKVEKYI